MPVTASPSNGLSGIKRSVPYAPPNVASFEIPQSAKARNSLSFEQFLRHFSFPCFSRR
jgi:hypothetical protein